MADEKIVKIVAQVDSNQGPSPEDELKAAINAKIAQERAEEAAAKNKYSAFLKHKMKAEEEEEKKSRGRPRRQNVPPPPPRGRAGAPPIQGGGDSDSPTSEQGQSRFAQAWKIFQKGVTAVNGANGHLTKSVAFLTRATQFAGQTVQGFQNAGITATGALQAVRNTGTAAAAGMKMSATAAQAVGAAAGTAAVALGAAGLAVVSFAVQIGIAVGALKILIGITNNLTEVVGKFSASLEAARANNKVLEIQSRMRSAGRIGGELGSLETSKGSAERAIIDLKTGLVDLLGPFIDVALQFFTNILKQLNIILAVINVIVEWIEYAVETILDRLSWIPIIGAAAKKALAWMQQDEVNNIKAANALHEKIEDLFEVDNVFPQKPKKNSVVNRFLP